MPFRVVQVGNVAERLFGFRLRTSEPQLVGDEQNPGLLQQIYNLKYARFGTSGVRGRWDVDFTEEKAKRVVQAICDYLKAANIPARIFADNFPVHPSIAQAGVSCEEVRGQLKRSARKLPAIRKSGPSDEPPTIHEKPLLINQLPL